MGDDARPGLTREDTRRLVRISVGCLLLGVVIVLIYATYVFFKVEATAMAMTLATGAMAAAAALVAGVLLGFLFGIPRSAQIAAADATNPPKDAAVASGSAAEYRPNTNLEQISDWLTKILIGVGLVELTTIVPKVEEMANTLAPGLGNQTGANAFALALLFYFTVCGFLLGYLWTRVFMPGVLKRAEGPIERLVKAATFGLDEAITAARAGTVDKTLALLRVAAAAGKSLGEVTGEVAAIQGGTKTFEAAALTLGGATAPQQLRDASAVRPTADRVISQIPDALRTAARVDTAGHLRGASVLWVDDQPENNNFLRGALVEFGVSVVLSRSTDDALAKLSGQKFDAIISDIRRPEHGEAGFNLLMELRKRGDQTSLVVYTSRATPELVRRAKRSGAVGLTSSPAELLQLLTESIDKN